MIRKEQAILPVSSWSGGTTTELFLYPENTSYTERNFDFRISTATVEVETSEFTVLPGYQRILMVLKGELTVVHETGIDDFRTTLLPAEQTHFDGAWKTTGFGKVTDFNVMLKAGYSAILETIQLKNSFSFVRGNTSLYTLFYLFSGILSSEGKCVGPGTVFILSEKEEIRFDAEADAFLVVVTIRNV